MVFNTTKKSHTPRLYHFGIVFGLFSLLLYSNCAKVAEDDSTAEVSSTCTAPSGVSSTPGTVEDVVRLVNSLPKPVTIPCFVQSLGRPLKIFASQSAASAQPAPNAENPRMFIFSNQLILTIVPAGPGKLLLEMGQLISSSESIKGELLFPISSKIPLDAPFIRIKSGAQTSCASCHASEQPLSGSSVAFSSRAIKASDTSRIAVTNLKTLSDTCNASNDLYRCLILRSVFNYGDVVEHSFPYGMQ
jgi:hypothetical protein